MALDFPSSPSPGEVFDGWTWDGSKWVSSGVPTGPEGPPGSPGTPGAPGAAGTDGTDGLPAWTTLDAGFAVPPIGGSVQIEVESTDWMTEGLPIFIDGEIYTVESVDSDTEVTLLHAGPSGAPPSGGGGSNEGVTDGSDAEPGEIGEYFEALTPPGTFTSIPNLTATPLLQIAMPAGDFDAWGQCTFSGTIANIMSISVTVSSANTNQIMPSAINSIDGGITPVVGPGTTIVAMPRRFSFAVSWTLYLRVSTNATSPQVAGYLCARRVR